MIFAYYMIMYVFQTAEYYVTLSPEPQAVEAFKTADGQNGKVAVYNVAELTGYNRVLNLAAKYNKNMERKAPKTPLVYAHQFQTGTPINPLSITNQSPINHQSITNQSPINHRSITDQSPINHLSHLCLNIFDFITNWASPIYKGVEKVHVDNIMKNILILEMLRYARILQG